MLRWVIFALLAISVADGLQTGSFQVPVNHFWPQDNRTVSFPYEFDNDYYVVGGPLFFYINEGGVYTNEWISQGLMYDVGRELGAVLLTTDLRFFRSNIPTETASLNDLSFLTIEQILADIAAFITQARTHLQVPPFSNVYVWGHGFGGTLAVLARQKYPFMINAAWSSGGIFLPTVFTTDNYDILDSNIFEYGGTTCHTRVRDAFVQIEQLLSAGNDSTLVNEFSICRPWDITNHMDVGIFSESLLGQISTFFDLYHQDGVDSFCRALESIPNDPMRSLARWVRFAYNADFGRCFNHDYNGRIKWAADEQWYNPGTATGMRQWVYFQCSQFGQLRITKLDGIFGHRITERYRYQICSEAFGPNFEFERLHLSNNDLTTIYGAGNPGVTGVIFSNGLLNEWYRQGIVFYYAENSHVFNIPGYGGQSDLSSLSGRDSIALYNTKLDIMSTFRNWERPWLSE